MPENEYAIDILVRDRRAGCESKEFGVSSPEDSCRSEEIGS